MKEGASQCTCSLDRPYQSSGAPVSVSVSESNVQPAGTPHRGTMPAGPFGWTPELVPVIPVTARPVSASPVGQRTVTSACQLLDHSTHAP